MASIFEPSPEAHATSAPQQGNQQPGPAASDSQKLGAGANAERPRRSHDLWAGRKPSSRAARSSAGARDQQENVPPLAVQPAAAGAQNAVPAAPATAKAPRSLALIVD